MELRAEGTQQMLDCALEVLQGRGGLEPAQEEERLEWLKGLELELE